jgi:hypothetical protein
VTKFDGTLRSTKSGKMPLKDQAHGIDTGPPRLLVVLSHIVDL